MSRPQSKPPTSAQLRASIDRGAAGDKAPAGDPAAAPLGADDEASGASPTAAQVEQSMAQEVDARPVDRDANAAASIPVAASVEAPAGADSRKARVAPWLVLAGGLAIVLLVFFAMT